MKSTFLALGIIFASMMIASGVLLFSSGNVAADTATTTVIVSNSAPVVSNISMNGGDNVVLTENTSTTTIATLTVTDANGCSEISTTTATFHRSGVSSDCSPDDNSCYTTTCVATGGSCTGGADTTTDFTCTFTVWYIADPTDAGSPNAGEIWTVSATGTDTSAAEGTATNSTQTIEVNTLLALNVTALIDYMTLAAGGDTGATNQTAVITNTGNIVQDDEISGEDMCTDFSACTGDAIPLVNQKYGLTNVTYASLTNTLTATTSPTTVQTTLAKATATTTASTDDTFWGINIPSGQTAGTYTGQNLFTAVTDS